MVREVYARVQQYAGLAMGALGWTHGRAPAGPLHAQIGVADPCNHRCVMCWDHPPEDRETASTEKRFGLARPGVMSLDVFERTVEDLHRLGTRRIDIVGRGEPLLNPNVAAMVALVKKRGMLATLTSNASRLTTAVADRLVEAGLDRLNVSLNAGTPETYPKIHVSETPDDYRAVKRNLRYLADRRAAAGKKAPYVKLSFVIGARNFGELEEMVGVVHEVGADEGMFVHTVVHEATPDLVLTRAQYEALLESVPRARARAKNFGVRTNIATFAATVPTYLHTQDLKGPAVVPCYVGWYFTLVLGNGSVLPCCQCSEPIDRVTSERGFGEIWSSQAYREFRSAARALPAANERLESCECDRCMLRPRNITVHNMLHPFNKIEGGDEEQLFTLRDLVRMKKMDRN
jgi:MoaA/NifB/PqqE/SkfB family radical SAM enzyme